MADSKYNNTAILIETAMEEEKSSRRNKGRDDKDKTFTENTPLYSRMTKVCHVLMFLYGAAYWIQIGVFPFLTKKLNVSTVTYGYLETVSSVAMLISGPFFGRFGDRFGAKSAMMACYIGSFVFYFFLAIADDVTDLFMSRVAAFLMHAFHSSQMVMTDVSGTKDRADALGKLGISYGVGMIVGPTLGGWLAKNYSEQFAAGVAGSLMIVAIVIVIFMIPSKTKDPKRVAATYDKNQEGSLLNVKAIVSLLAIPEVLYLIVLKLFVAIPVGVFHAMFPIINIEKFGLTPQTNGYLLTYIGILTAIMQAVGISFITKRIPSDLRILQVSIVIKCFSYFALAWIDNFWLLAATFIPMVMASALMNTVANSTLTKKVPESATGTSLGLSMATHSMIRSISPTLGAWLYTSFGYPSIGLLGFVLNGLVAVVIIFYHPPGFAS